MLIRCLPDLNLYIRQFWPTHYNFRHATIVRSVTQSWRLFLIHVSPPPKKEKTFTFLNISAKRKRLFGIQHRETEKSLIPKSYTYLQLTVGYPPSHIHCFIPGSKLTNSTNLFHHSLLAPTWTAFTDYTGPDLLCSTVFHF